jgi:nitrite reductase (NO-forming)
VRYAAWTFEGAVPGPALRVRQGDTVAFTLINKANMPHSMDFHAAEIAPSKYYVNVMPNDSLQYATHPIDVGPGELIRAPCGRWHVRAGVRG